MIKKLFFVVLTAFCFTGAVHCFPVLTGRVVDDANILSEQQKNDLERVLERADPHQVVAVSLNSLDGKEIEEYGYQLGRHWGIGRKGENDGVLVLIAPNQRQLRIEVGYGLEHILTDAQSSNIVNHIMVPLARDGRYDEALIQGATAVVQLLSGEPIESVETAENVSTSYGSPVVAGVLGISFLLWFVLMYGLAFVQMKFKHYKRSSRQNRFLFFYENVLCSSFTYNTVMIIILAGTQSVLLYLVLLLLGLCVVNSGNIKRWRKNPKFPYKKQFQQSGGGGSSSHSGGGRSYSHGGSSFHGGGGSFGGGGASGRF